jgi:hypothetical protein
MKENFGTTQTFTTHSSIVKAKLFYCASLSVGAKVYIHSVLGEFIEVGVVEYVSNSFIKIINGEGCMQLPRNRLLIVSNLFNIINN